jgi:hypothetical protein
MIAIKTGCSDSRVHVVMTLDMRARRLRGNPEPEPPEVRQEPPDLTAAADLGASIAEHAIRLAHMYFERARMFRAAGSDPSAVQDKSRAETLYEWAMQATAATNVAGHDAVQPQLEHLKSEVDSLQLSKRAGNTR